MRRKGAGLEAKPVDSGDVHNAALRVNDVSAVRM
jgi:hypothetical protein